MPDYDVAAQSVCQVTLSGTLFNQVVMNTLHYRLDLAGGVLTGGGAFLADFDAALQAAGSLTEKYVACVPALMLNIKQDLQWIDVTRYVKRSFVVGPVGGAAHVPTTANNAACVELRGNIADKRGIGTKHIPGLGGNAVAAGLVTAGLLAALEDFAIDCTLDVTVGARTMSPIIFGRARASYVNKHGVTVPAIPKSYRGVTAWNVQPTARVMRRRTVGLGI